MNMISRRKFSDDAREAQTMLNLLAGETPDRKPDIKDDGNTDTKTGKKYQYERGDNPNSLIHRIGYTVDEVKKILESDA